MSLETEHRRHHTEPTPYPDEPQPIKWTGRRAAFATNETRRMEALAALRAFPQFPGQHRKPWGRRAAPWTLATAETDQQARYPEWSMA